MRPALLELDVDSFAGPFDLLCTVLLRRELGVQDVMLAEVVVAYVQRLAIEERVDPDTASEFLVLVAALMEIKARELLAADAALDIEEPQLLEAQAEMYERLVTYATFKNAASWLKGHGHRERFWRVASRPVIRKAKTYEGPVIDAGLLRRAMTVLLAQPDVDVRHLVGKHASVHEMTGRLLTVLQRRRSCTLDDVADGLSRLDQAVAFVAALELAKNGKVRLQQAHAFAPIEVLARSAEEQRAAAGADVVDAADQQAEAQDAEEFQIA